MRWSEAGYLSQIVLTHALRQVSVSLILGVRQKMPFPDKVLLHPSNGGVIFIYDWSVALARLSYFAREAPDHIVFEMPDGSYAQCAGTKTCLTVETRTYRPDFTFTHLTWGIGKPSGRRSNVEGSGGLIDVDSSQVLQMRDARIILKGFIEGETIPPRYHATDSTVFFEPVPPGMRVMHKAWDWPDRRPKK